MPCSNSVGLPISSIRSPYRFRQLDALDALLAMLALEALLCMNNRLLPMVSFEPFLLRLLMDGLPMAEGCKLLIEGRESNAGERQSRSFSEL